MFEPLILKPVDIRVIRKSDENIELCLMKSLGKKLAIVTHEEFVRLFPKAPTDRKFSIVVMDKTVAEEFFEQQNI